MKDWKKNIGEKVINTYVNGCFEFNKSIDTEDIKDIRMLIEETLNLAEGHFNWLCEAGQESDMNYLKAQKEIKRLNELLDKAYADIEWKDLRIKKALEELCLHSKEGYTTEVWIRKHFAEFMYGTVAPTVPKEDK